MKTTILTLATVMLLPHVAQAQVCMTPDEMHAALVDWYGEAPTGPKSETGMFPTQMWASVENDSWTLIRYETPTSACVVAQGTDVASVNTTPQVVAALVSNQ